MMKNTNKTNEIPALRNNNEMTFTRLGPDEDIDMTLERKTQRMTFQRLEYNEETGDWDGKEVYASEVEEELENYTFSTITEKPLSFRQLKAIFSHKMFAIR